MSKDVKENLTKALLKKNPNRLAVSIWLNDHPNANKKFYDYIETFFKIRYDTNPQMGVGTLLSALQADAEIEFKGIGVDSLRRWLNRNYPDA